MVSVWCLRLRVNYWPWRLPIWASLRYLLPRKLYALSPCDRNVITKIPRRRRTCVDVHWVGSLVISAKPITNGLHAYVNLVICICLRSLLCFIRMACKLGNQSPVPSGLWNIYIFVLFLVENFGQVFGLGSLNQLWLQFGQTHSIKSTEGK